MSPWVTLVEREVIGLAGAAAPAVYHALKVADYVAIVAQTEDGLYPVIRQFRPAVRQFIWELPAGLVEPGETPEETCLRELKEETGLVASSVTNCGSYFSDSGRIDNRIHVFAARTNGRAANFVCEPGTDVAFWSRDEMRRAILDGRFSHFLHVAAFLWVVSVLANPNE